MKFEFKHGEIIVTTIKADSLEEAEKEFFELHPNVNIIDVKELEGDIVKNCRTCKTFDCHRCSQ